MSSCQSVEKSIAIYHVLGALAAGTVVTIPDPDLAGDMWKVITVINDTDQDIKVSFKSTAGHDNAFIVPKSVKGFTRALKNSMISNASNITVTSMNVSNAVGNITINLAV